MSQYEEYYMEKNGEYYREEPTDSFLAGLLFCKDIVDYSDYVKLKGAFEKKYEVDVVDRENLRVRLVAQGTSIRLVDDYDDVLFVDGKYVSVRYYLYSLTSNEVREFFGIREPKDNKLKNYLRFLRDNLQKKERKGRRK